MGFTPKNWENTPSVATPISEAALEDLETRVTDHADIRGASTSVMDPVFEVTGDGATDDTVGFESARTAAGVGGHVYVPPNTYVVNDVDLNVDRQTWTFAPGAIIKLKDSAVGELCCFNVTGDYVTIDGGQWDGNRAANSTYNTGVIQLRGANRARIQNIYLHDAQCFGIRGFPTATNTAMNDVEIRGCTFVDCVGGAVFFDYGALGAPITPSNGIRIVSCWSDNSNVAAATVTGGGFSIYGHTSTVANMPRGCVISDCYARSRADATTENAGIGVTQVNGAQITGCYSADMSFESFLIILSKNVAVSGCTAVGSETYGFEVAGDSTATVSASVTGCYVDGSAAMACGIMVNAGEDVTVSGNVVRNLLDASLSAGISIANPEDIAGTGRITITGNTIRTTDRGISDNDGTAKHVLIADNTIYGPDGGGYGVVVDWTGAAGASMRRVIRDNLISDFIYGVRLTNGNAATTFSDVTVRDNTFISIAVANKLTAEANIVWDNTCIIYDDTDIPGVASVAGNITLPFASTVQLTGTDSVTSITASYPGRTVKLINASTAKLVDGSNLKLAGDGPNSADDTITIVCDGTNWIETGRSVN